MHAARRRTRKATRRTGPRAEAALRTREALIAAGTALFAEQGLDAPSLDAICERAGKTRGAFYVHFRDRDDFLVAVMDQVGTAFLDAVLQAPGDLASTVRRFLVAFLSGAYPLTERGGVRPHQLLDACFRSAEVRERYVRLVRESMRRVTGLIEEDQRAERLRPDVNPTRMADLMLAVVIGAHTLLELGVRFDPAGMAEEILHLLRPPKR